MRQQPIRGRPRVALAEKERLTQEETAREMGLSVRQVGQMLGRYRDSGGKLESLAYQGRHAAANVFPERTRQQIRHLHREYPDRSSGG